LHSGVIHVPGYNKLLSYVVKYEGIEKNKKGRSSGNKREKKYGRIIGSNR